MPWRYERANMPPPVTKNRLTVINFEAALYEVGGGEIVQQKNTKNYLSVDGDEQHVGKWVFVSRRATTAALCHRVTSSASRPRRGDAALSRVLDKNLS